MNDAGVLSMATASLPGRSLDASARLRVLDERDEWGAFSRRVASGDGLWESTVAFEGMYCAACAGTIEDALRAVPGVLEADVSAAGQRGRVVWDEHHVLPSQWIEALDGTGYRAVPVPDLAAAERRQADTRRMLWRLGVAGLCSTQVMMYAAPIYFSAPGAMAPDIVHLLRWAQWLLSLPVLLFSCQPFLQGAWRDVRRRQISMDLPVALGMILTFIVSSLGTFEPDGLFGHEVYFDSFTMFVFFLLGGRWLELRLRDRAAGALEVLMQRLPDTVERRRDDGAWSRVAARRVQVGDVVRVLAGEVFPADGVIIRGSTAVDEALLSGESRPLLRAPGEMVIAGSNNLGAVVEIEIRQVGATTRYAQIVGLMQQAAASRPDLARLVDRLARPFLLLVLLAAGAACAWWWPTDPGRAVMVAVAILVVTCPCALSLATPAAMLASAGSLARRGVLVRDLQGIEALATIDTVAFDKTGTLTRDAFVLERIDLRPGLARSEALALAASLAQGSLHPVSRGLVATAHEEDVAVPVLAQAVHERAGQGVAGQLATSQGVRQLRLGSAALCGVAPQAADGPVTHLADGDGWLASFFFHEDLRDDARATVAALHADGLETWLLSGDQLQAAERIGRLTGVARVLAGCSPADKLQQLQQAQQAGARVAMVGDGLNDGPVLAGAQVSFAFGRAVPLAQAQSDFVVLSEKLSAVVETRRQALDTLRIVRQNLGWALLYNAIGVPLAMVGLMPAWAAGLGMAISSLVVILNALRLSRLPAPEPA